MDSTPLESAIPQTTIENLRESIKLRFPDISTSSQEMLTRTAIRLATMKRKDDYSEKILQGVVHRLSMLEKILRLSDDFEAHIQAIIECIQDSTEPWNTNKEIDSDSGMLKIRAYLEENPLLKNNLEVGTACATIFAFLRQNVDIGGVVVPQP